MSRKKNGKARVPLKRPRMGLAVIPPGFLVQVPLKRLKKHPREPKRQRKCQYCKGIGLSSRRISTSGAPNYCDRCMGSGLVYSFKR